MLTIDEFKKIEITLGRILSVEKVPDTDKLLKLSVDFGPAAQPVEAAVGEEQATVEAANVSEEPQQAHEAREMRQVVSGIALYLPDPQVLVGRVVPFVTNLEPRTIRGLESQAMILAASTADGQFSVLETTLAPLPEGTRLA